MIMKGKLPASTEILELSHQPLLIEALKKRNLKESKEISKKILQILVETLLMKSMLILKPN